MEAKDLIQVLWVEDDPKVTDAYPLKAEVFGLELVHYPCWDDAKTALEEDFDRWSAIILDAKCKFHRDSEDNAVVFLREALDDISTICERKGRIIPWYVLTGGAETEVSDSINDKRLQWDRDWTASTNKKYYSKNVDNEILYSRIRYHASISPRTHIVQMYKKVFDAIEYCGMDVESKLAMEDLLVPIHFPQTIEENDYNAKFEKAREVLEYMFRSMSDQGMLPNWGRQVNLRWSSIILSGKSAIDSNGKIAIESKKILPDAFMLLLKTMLNIIPPFCHSGEDSSDGINKVEYMSDVESSTLLLKSFALQLCDLLIWYKNYLLQHPDKKENEKLWIDLRKNGSK